MISLEIGATIGILGGGQLGRMLSVAGAQLGFDISIYCPEEDCPAARVSAQHICADYADLDTVLAWAKTCGAVTYEFENVPVATIQHLIENGVPVRPGSAPLKHSQDRLVEKIFLRDTGIQTGAFAEINQASDIAAPLQRFGGKGILKTRRDGYDGKGQVRLEAGDDYEEAYHALNYQPAILEAMVPFEREASVILARSMASEIACYDMPQNQHVNGILKRSAVPSGLNRETVNRAYEATKKLAEALDYIGVLALEFFILEDGSLIANEFAPRVHNSGHWTPEACATGQFEQHMRAVAGWPLGETRRFHDVEMLNLLGEDIFEYPAGLSGDTVLTLYGKREAKAGRKMGHIVRRLPGSD
ncbi:MAG: 5-(carboxyamino)imidazole ribonucleotide synthase [Henriciella sp.]